MKQKILKKLRPYAALRGEKNYHFYLLYAICGRIGDSIDALAFSWIAYQLSGSASWLAIIAGINVLPTIFLTPLAAPIVERWPKKPVMCASTLMRAGFVCLTGALMLEGMLTVWHLSLITFLMSTVESLSDPAFIACTPHIIPEEKMETALSLLSVVSQSCQLLGSALGGLFIGTLGSAWALAIDALLFILASFPLATLRFQQKIDPKQESGQAKTYVQAFRSGLSYFSGNPTLVLLCFFGILFNVLAGPLGQLEAACIVEILRLDAFALSVSGAACSIGMLLGSLLYPLLSSKLTIRRMFVLSSLSLALCYVGLNALGLVPVTAIRYTGLGLLYFMFTAVVSLFSVMSNVLFFKVVAPEYLARMASIFNALSCLGVPLASVLGGTLSGMLPLYAVFLVCGVLALLQTLVLCFARVFNRLEEFHTGMSNSSVS